MGTLPPDFEAKLVTAIKASPRLDNYDRRYLSSVTGIKLH